MAFIIFVIVVVALLVYAYIRNRTIMNKGLTAEALVSRIEKDESVEDDNVTYHYYVTYKDETDNVQEAVILNQLNNTYSIGQKLTVKYLKEKKNQVVII